MMIITSQDPIPSQHPPPPRLSLHLHHSGCRLRLHLPVVDSCVVPPHSQLRKDMEDPFSRPQAGSLGWEVDDMLWKRKVVAMLGLLSSVRDWPNIAGLQDVDGNPIVNADVWSYMLAWWISSSYKLVEMWLRSHDGPSTSAWKMPDALMIPLMIIPVKRWLAEDPSDGSQYSCVPWFAMTFHKFNHAFCTNDQVDDRDH